uniref:Uncharacterized protein n=1 Tax=Anguilla anguilla TaxID=7936 RepID=A0A0E9UV50_ANGAN
MSLSRYGVTVAHKHPQSLICARELILVPRTTTSTEVHQLCISEQSLTLTDKDETWVVAVWRWWSATVCFSFNLATYFIGAHNSF